MIVLGDPKRFQYSSLPHLHEVVGEVVEQKVGPIYPNDQALIVASKRRPSAFAFSADHPLLQMHLDCVCLSSWAAAFLELDPLKAAFAIAPIELFAALDEAVETPVAGQPLMDAHLKEHLDEH